MCARLRAACEREEARALTSSAAASSASPACGGWLTPAVVARELAVTLSVAQEHLLLAERRGALCRDDGPDGLRFFRNRFGEFLLAGGQQQQQARAGAAAA